ncbi:MAG: 1-acyl-sn-glycerol-3-phosphate acyltransferase [Saprospiraceae bacterium]
MNTTTIDVEKIIKDKNPGLYHLLPGFIIRYLKRIVHEDEMNHFLQNHGQKKDFEFLTAVLDEFKPKINIEGLENIPEKGGAILAANHPLGGLDAITLMLLVSTRRKDMKYLVNDILMNIKPLENLFVPINKHGRNNTKSLGDINSTYASDQLVLVFPAGLVSRQINGEVRDLEWKKSFVTQAKKYQKPIIPVYISGSLSPFFYRLSRWRSKIGIAANIEMLYLVDEMYKQKGKQINITVFPPIDVSNSSEKDMQIATNIRNLIYQSSK